jgi:2-keto-4-pentenoate hydratase/2-oxohepta-3-ene-1,7-dioic acid hydratase in catechol pathway
MRLVRVGEPGSERAAVLGADGSIRRLPSSLGDIDAGFWTDGRADATRRLLDADELNEVIEGPVRYGPPIAKPEKVVCIGLNYRDHAKESGAAIPTEPIVFMKAPNCVVGPNDEVLVPRGSVKTDVSEREFQLERGGQWDKGKCCETFNPLGPWLVTADEVANPQALGLRLSVNGVSRQNGTTAEMVFGVHYLVWYLSQFMVLEPGDLINTGTPAGVSLGHDDVPFLKVGDVVELEIDGLGAQRSPIGQA